MKTSRERREAVTPRDLRRALRVVDRGADLSEGDGTCSTEREPGDNLRIDCATGFGSAVWITGAFGLAAAQEVVGVLLARKD